MRSFKMMVLAVVFAILSQNIVCAIQSSNITGQKEINKNAAAQAMAVDTLEKIDKLTDRYYDNLRACVPFHFTQSMDIFGLKFGMNIHINGWNNDKCEYRMGFNLDSLGKDIREVFNVKVTDEQLAKLKPVVECNFTKEQLNLAVDAIIARNERRVDQIREMLENPNEKYVNNKSAQKLTKEEEKLIAAMMGSNACVVPNQEELMNSLTEIMYSSKSDSSKDFKPSNSDEVQKPQKPEY